MKDFLGREYGPGDLVIYGASGGRSINMVIGRVERIEVKVYSHDDYRWHALKDGETVPAGKDEREVKTTIRVMPLRASRWKQHRGHDYYVDARTEKKIDPYKGYEHTLSGGYEIDTRTGERIPASSHSLPSWDPRYVPWQHRKYVHRVFQPWVEQRNDGIKAVSISVTENIVRWDGELPPEEEAEAT